MGINKRRGRHGEKKTLVEERSGGLIYVEGSDYCTNGQHNDKYIQTRTNVVKKKTAIRRERSVKSRDNGTNNERRRLVHGERERVCGKEFNTQLPAPASSNLLSSFCSLLLCLYRTMPGAVVVSWMDWLAPLLFVNKFWSSRIVARHLDRSSGSAC